MFTDTTIIKYNIYEKYMISFKKGFRVNYSNEAFTAVVHRLNESQKNVSIIKYVCSI